jgi:lipid-A-disaccharide synthase
MTRSHSMMIVAGEASADLHGAQVVAELNRRDPALKIFGVGGQAMRSQDFEALVRAEEMSLAGLTEVLMGLPRMFRIMEELTRAAQTRRPDVVMLIDLPDFNIRLAKRLKKLGIPVVYYISPQIWAWRQGRVEQIRRFVDKMLVILPFEKDFYKSHEVDVEFVGHPLVEELADAPTQAIARTQLGLQKPSGPILALLPGSRQKEVSRHLPIMLEAVGLLREEAPGIQALIPVASTISKSWVEALVQDANVRAEVIDGKAVEIVRACDAAVVCSGTSTLQTALLHKPMVVVYKVSWFTHFILKRLVKVAYIALVNLIAGKELVTELVQNAFTARRLKDELRNILDNPEKQAALKDGFEEIRASLGDGAVAGRVADAIAEFLDSPEQNP